MAALVDPANYAFNWAAVPTLLTAVAMFLLAALVVVQERGSAEAGNFSLLAATICIWLTCFSVMYLATDQRAALAWARAAYFGVTLIPAALYHFSVAVTRSRRRHLVLPAWLLSALFCLLSVATPALVRDLYRYSWGFYPRFRWLGAPFLSFFFVMLALTLREYWRGYRAARPGTYRLRTRWLMIGVAIAYLGSFDYVAAYGISLYPFGCLPVLAFIAVTAYTIERYHLVDLTPAFAAEQIIATVADPVIVCDCDGTMRFSNQAATAVFGYDKSELAGAPIELLAGAAPRAAVLSEALGWSELRNVEMTFRTRKGEPVAVEVSLSALLDHRGQHVGSVLVARDIRTRKRAAAELHAAQQRLHHVVTSSPTVLGTRRLDEDGRWALSWVSDNVTRLTGYSAEEVMAPDWWASHLHPEDAGQRERMFAALPESGLASCDYRLRHRDGSYRWVRSEAVLIRDAAGHPIEMVGSWSDVTENKRLEAQFLQSQKMESVGRLAAGVAHDFNNLLTVIVGYGHLLVDALASRRQLQANVKEIVRAGESAATLTRQLLTFSRRQVLVPEILDLNTTVHLIEPMLRRLIGEDLELVIDLASDLGRIKADPGHIEQVIVNLVVNGRDAMPEGGRISIASRNRATLRGEGAGTANAGPAGWVELSVSDNGIGMDSEILSHIFEPFFTTKEKGRGTGLGLATVYGIVQQSGGRIEVASRPGAGSTFSIFLPRVEGPAAAVQPLAAGLLPGDETILIAEDEPAVRILAREILTGCGYRVLEAGGAEEALRISGEHAGPIDLLLADLIMPDQRGDVLAVMMAARRPGLRVLLMSGYSDRALEASALGAEVSLVQKPFSPTLLSRQVRQALDRRAPVPRRAPASPADQAAEPGAGLAPEPWPTGAPHRTSTPGRLASGRSGSRRGRTRRPSR